MKPWGLTPIPENIPDVLRVWRRWVVWVAVPRVGVQGKYDKIPRQCGARWRQGASTNNPAHWFEFDEAVETYRQHSSVLSGIGLVLTKCEDVDDARGANRAPLFAIDIDRCAPDDERVELLKRIRGMYVEQSPSGHGYRGLGFGPVLDSFINIDAGIEIYDGRTPRFVTVTGRAL